MTISVTSSVQGSKKNSAEGPFELLSVRIIVMATCCPDPSECVLQVVLLQFCSADILHVPGVHQHFEEMAQGSNIYQPSNESNAARSFYYRFAICVPQTSNIGFNFVKRIFPYVLVSFLERSLAVFLKLGQQYFYEGCEGRCQGCQKGRQLDVGAQWPPRLLVLHMTYRKSKNFIRIIQFAGKPSLRESRVRLKALFDYNPFVSRFHSCAFFTFFCFTLSNISAVR